jgi:hypothetical protein
MAVVLNKMVHLEGTVIFNRAVHKAEAASEAVDTMLETMVLTEAIMEATASGGYHDEGYGLGIH